MKITFNIDCTPEEARTFFGLPDVKPMQDALLAKVQDRLSGNIDAMTPDSLVKSWLPASFQGMDQVQKMFWNSFQKAAGSATRSSKEG